MTAIWNTIDMSGVNEVNFIQAMLDAEYLEGGPKLAMGFSGGAAMSSLMCCKNTTDVIVAHVEPHSIQVAVMLFRGKIVD